MWNDSLYRITWDMKQVKAYIRNKLARVADYRCKLDKPLRLKQWAEPKVVNMFIKYLWTEDTYWYRDQGVRLHLHLVIALLSATGVRPSSILRDGRQYEFDPVEDIAYQKSKLHGLRYGDVELGIVQHQNELGEILGPPVWRMAMKFKNQKNARALDGGITDAEHVLEDIQQSTRCLLAIFVAHALRMGAIKEPHLLFEDTTDVDYRIVSFKEEFLDREIVPMYLASAYEYFKRATARAGFNQGEGLPLYSVRRGTYTEQWKNETQTVPDRLIQFNHKSVQIGVTNYFKRAIYVQSRDIRRGIEVTEVERRLATVPTPDNIFHPPRKLVQSYYAQKPEPYTSQKRAEFIFALVNYSEGPRPPGVDVAVDESTNAKATLEDDLQECYESDMEDDIDIEDDKTGGNETQQYHEGAMEDDQETDSNGMATDNEFENSYETDGIESTTAHTNYATDNDSNVQMGSLPDEDETHVDIENDAPRDTETNGDMEDEMNDLMERNVETESLPDEDETNIDIEDDAPHDTETDVDMGKSQVESREDVARVSDNGHDNGYAGNNNNRGELYTCCLNARHQLVSLEIHLEQQHRVDFSQRNHDFLCPCGLRLTKSTQIKRHFNGHTTCQLITNDWDCRKPRLLNNLYCNEHDRGLGQHKKHICCTAAWHEGKDKFTRHMMADHVAFSESGERVCYVCDTPIRDIAEHMRSYHILCWSSTRCYKPRAFPLVHCSSHKEQPLRHDQSMRRKCDERRKGRIDERTRAELARAQSDRRKQRRAAISRKPRSKNPKAEQWILRAAEKRTAERRAAA